MATKTRVTLKVLSRLLKTYIDKLVIIIIHLLLPDHILKTLYNVDILRWLLHHLHPLSPHLHHCQEQVQLPHLGVEVIIHQLVHTYKGSSPPHPSTAVNKYWNI